MISFVIWTLVAGVIVLWNQFDWGPYIGVRFTDRWLGQPLSGAWLAGAVALYCLIRLLWRQRGKQAPEGD